jgi:hypothetical protein
MKYSLSHFFRLVDAKQFEHLSLVELHRRGIENSQQVGVVMDGGDSAANNNAL